MTGQGCGPGSKLPPVFHIVILGQVVHDSDLPQLHLRPHPSACDSGYEGCCQMSCNRYLMMPRMIYPFSGLNLMAGYLFKCTNDGHRCLRDTKRGIMPGCI